MELKDYQQKVLDDLQKYLEYAQETGKYHKAFNQYWEDRIGPYNPLENSGMQPYKDNIPGAPHIAIKVPTSGGKTFIACNALRTVFNAFDTSMPKVVVWLVPWSNLLQQTIDRLSDPEHPYNQKLNSLFNHRVQVYTKDQVESGANFNPTVVQDQLSIIVMSFASLRARRKEDRRAYQMNGQLAPFAEQYKDRSHLMENTDDTALINVIRSYNPVLVVDESHNAESDLSVDMLKGLNPSLILDLTATPRDNSNIISLVPAKELKRNNMVKLPVIVYNHHDKTEVINSALHLQRKLELKAREEEEAGGKYIRPIVLFQAQPKTKDDSTTFEKVKKQLLEVGIPEEQIKIKTANKDELKGVDLMSRDCPVRYIITINALKEGWDCPFAYILASLADKSSAVDVEQILGRVLRQPYVMRHTAFQLNVSYVLTASAKFNETLQNIVNGLQASGFSERDYRKKDLMSEEEKTKSGESAVEDFLFPERDKEEPKEEEDIDTKRLTYPTSEENETINDPAVAEIESLAEEQSREMEEELKDQTEESDDDYILKEMGMQEKRYRMVDAHREAAKKIKLPQFTFETPGSDIFGIGEELLNRESLLKNFPLSREDTKIDFDRVSADMYKVDIEEVKKDQYSPRFRKIEDDLLREPIAQYILAKPREGQVKDITDQLVKQIGDMYPIPDQEIRQYVERVIGGFNQEQLRDILARKYSYAGKIKDKIRQLSDVYAEKLFDDLVKIRKVKTRANWNFRETITPKRLGSSISNSLYEREAHMNDLETSVATELAGMDNIQFWHRNLERGKGFAINGFKSNHYPDFILLTAKGNIILLETKGDDRDNTDSESKVRLGNKWADLAGDEFYYFMVFDRTSITGAYEWRKAKELIGRL